MALDSSVFIHKNALCESEDIGPRTRIWAFAHIMKGAHVGTDCNICDHVFIESGASIGDRVTVKNSVLLWDRVTIENEVFLGPNVVFTNDRVPRISFKTLPADFLPTLVQHGASIGANTTIVCGVRIGSYALIGAGTVVTRDVPAFALVVGNPGRRRGWICACGETLDSALACTCGRHYSMVDEAVGLTLRSTFR